MVQKNNKKDEPDAGVELLLISFQSHRFKLHASLPRNLEIPLHPIVLLEREYLRVSRSTD